MICQYNLQKYEIISKNTPYNRAYLSTIAHDEQHRNAANRCTVHFFAKKFAHSKK